jgi:tetrahydromethanopterin S-methyltransferase subunit H
MFSFKKNQVVCDIGGVKIGGNVGEIPTVMIGSIFYKKDKIVKDENQGIFDRERAEELIAKVEEVSDRTGLSAMLDVVCTNSKNAEKYLNFAADATTMPILIDAVSEEAAITGLNRAKQLGVIDRTILNSLNPETEDAVYKKIKDVGLESAIALIYSTRAIISSNERINILNRIMPKMDSAGIRNILVDTVVLDIPTLGLACKAIYQVKNQFGYPAGCGAHNAIESWGALKKKKDDRLTLSCSLIINGLPIAIGADFVLYGPIKTAEHMFPAISLVDAAYGQVMIEEGKHLNPNHPRFKVSRL